MKEELIARTQLVDPKTGRHIKRIDERNIVDFFNLISEKKESKVLYIPDFSPLISIVSQQIDDLISGHSDKELRVMHSTVYNMWNKAKISNVLTIKEKLNIEVLTKSEEALNVLHERLPDFERRYISPEQSPYSGVTPMQIDKGLDELLSEVRVFVEIALCHIHSSVILDPNLLKEPSIHQHCVTIQSKLREWLYRECGITFNWDNTYNIANDSFIFQLCIEENMPFDSKVMISLLELIDIKSTADVTHKIFNKILSHSTRGYQMNYIEWPQAKPDHVNRAAKIIDLLQQINSILTLFSKTQDNEVKYDSVSDVFLEIRQLKE
ncbi:hypothetical protein C9I86_05695 [Photobacterium sp. NCIMB 13483]|uniref:hypothetical protein n=1 Tax=Photobacterium sp. NCIMB 13483 TaxID=2022103 RepID=UPI000D167767|nr:hypothetical protein [Photobacterium sp. NCIMB 13483]PST93645.1 hypothetical protein C9I86_05695 [Photobacterium sp. NCIMB 13483]